MRFLDYISLRYISLEMTNETLINRKNNYFWKNFIHFFNFL